MAPVDASRIAVMEASLVRRLDNLSQDFVWKLVAADLCPVGMTKSVIWYSVFDLTAISCGGQTLYDAAKKDSPIACTWRSIPQNMHPALWVWQRTIHTIDIFQPLGLEKIHPRHYRMWMHALGLKKMACQPATSNCLKCDACPPPPHIIKEKTWHQPKELRVLFKHNRSMLSHTDH